MAFAQYVGLTLKEMSEARMNACIENIVKMLHSTTPATQQQSSVEPLQVIHPATSPPLVLPNSESMSQNLFSNLLIHILLSAFYVTSVYAVALARKSCIRMSFWRQKLKMEKISKKVEKKPKPEQKPENVNHLFAKTVFASNIEENPTAQIDPSKVESKWLKVKSLAKEFDSSYMIVK